MGTMTQGSSMPDDLFIRLATEDDAGAIARLALELGYPSAVETVRTRIRQILSSPADVLLVASKGADGVGSWMQAHTSVTVESGSRVEIVGLVVAPAARRAGVGRRLVAAAEQWARSRGIDVVLVGSNIKRMASHAFYPALGYEQTKTQQVYRKTLRESGDTRDAAGHDE